MRQRERTVGALAILIAGDKSPGIVAADLAHAVVSLVEERSPAESIEIGSALIKLSRRKAGIACD